MRALPHLAVLAAFAVVGVAGEARAYCLTKACDNRPAYDDVWQSEPDPPCTRDSVGCLLEGQPLHWPATCVSYAVQRDGSPADGIDFETVSAIIDQAFSTWQGADCGGGLASIEVQDLGAVSCNRVEYNQSQANANIFMFRDNSWPYKNAEDTLALTTVTYNTENAEIYDADVEINSFEATFTTTDDVALIDTDLLAVVTHEVGHFLGLSHSQLRGATMYPDYRPKDTHQRTLDADDIEAICLAYPPDRSVNANQCTPRHGFSSQCAVTDDGGCSVSSDRRDSPTMLFALAPLGAALLLRRRRRGRRRAAA